MAPANQGELSSSASETRFFLLAGRNFGSPRSFTISSILILSMISGFYYLILGPYGGMRAYHSLLYTPNDCRSDPGWVPIIGVHCFGDYLSPLFPAMQSDPWSGVDPTNYPATGIAIFWIFGHIGLWLGSRFSLLAYIGLLTAAILTPAVWAARASKAHEKIVVFLVCGVAAIPGLLTIDRGNSIGFEVPIMLAYLIALRREKWKNVAILVVLAALIKPQFALLGVALLAAREWRLSLQAGMGLVITSILAYLLWPADFPSTIDRSVKMILNYTSPAGGNISSTPIIRYNVSFIKGIFLLPDALAANKTGGVLPADYLNYGRLSVGFGITILILLCLLLLGRRIPPMIAGITLLATASLFVNVSHNYYLIFAIPIAALIMRDPQGFPGSGSLDTISKSHRIAVFLISISTSASIAQIPLPLPVAVKAYTAGGKLYPIDGAGPLNVETTAVLTPLLWLATCLAIIVSFTLTRDRSDGKSNFSSDDSPRSDCAIK